MKFRIDELRRCKNISQIDLSRRSGVSRATIIALENGSKKNTTVDTLLKIADALEVEIDDLFTE